MTFARLSVGKRGEAAASRYLKKLGYKILELNYRQQVGEIDIIARDGKCLVFVEVKTRTGKTFGHPAEAVTSRKQKQICKTALTYMIEKNLDRHEARFDIIAVTIDDKNHTCCEHIKDAFENVVL